MTLKYLNVYKIMKSAVYVILILILLNGCSYISSVNRYYTYVHDKNEDTIKDTCIISDECNMIFGTFKAESVSDYAVLIYKENADSMPFLTATKLFQTKDKSYSFAVNLLSGSYQLDIVKITENNSSIRLINPTSINFSIPIKADNINKIIVLDPVISGTSHISPERQNSVENIFIKNDITYLLSKENMFYDNKKHRLDSSVFSDKLIEEGMYNITEFNRKTTYMYSIGEQDSKKIPLLFIHGAFGSPKNFSKIIDSIDKTKFTPYVVFYPGGESLELDANILSYMLFSSGIIQDVPFAIIAHSMGGLIAKAALNKKEMLNIKSPHLLISIGSPFGGNKFAVTAHKAPYVIPMWRDISPNSNFIQTLFLKKANNVKHYLFFSFKEENSMKKFLPNNDGVVSITSQLNYLSQENAIAIYGLDETHTSILESSILINKINIIIEKFYEDKFETYNGLNI